MRYTINEKVYYANTGWGIVINTNTPLIVIFHLWSCSNQVLNILTEMAQIYWAINVYSVFQN